jgi:hypothetical protein
MTLWAYMLTGPGLLTGSIAASADRAEVERVAKEQARSIKRREGLQWVRWTIYDATSHFSK